MQILIENSQFMNLLYSQIKDDQDNFLDKFQQEEKFLEKKLSELNGLKLILSQDELNNEINNYNESYSNFNIKIENFNLHYDNQINNLKDKIYEKFFFTIFIFNI